MAPGEILIHHKKLNENEKENIDCFYFDEDREREGQGKNMRFSKDRNGLFKVIKTILNCPEIQPQSFPDKILKTGILHEDTRTYPHFPI